MCIICAHPSSKTLAGKSGAIFASKPLRSHSLEQARQSGLFDVIEHGLHSDEVAQTFPVHEYWRDIGRRDDLQRASEDCGEIFCEE